MPGDQLWIPQQSHTAAAPTPRSKRELSWGFGFHRASPKGCQDTATSSKPAPSTWCSGKALWH